MDHFTRPTSRAVIEARNMNEIIRTLRPLAGSGIRQSDVSIRIVGPKGDTLFSAARGRAAGPWSVRYVTGLLDMEVLP